MDINKKRGTRALTLVINKICPKSKRSQMEMSFGMIFSIIAIIAFIVFAVYGISIFLDNQKNIQVGMFVNQLQEEVDKMWQDTGQTERTYNLPGKIEYVCFIDYNSPANNQNQKEIYDELELYSEEGNMFFYPHDFEGKTIEHIDIDEITNEKNPLCIKNSNGIKITIKKDFGDSLVNIIE